MAISPAGGNPSRTPCGHSFLLLTGDNITSNVFSLAESFVKSADLVLLRCECYREEQRSRSVVVDNRRML